jgi:glycerophosphoryl diester phosphodiesterase
MILLSARYGRWLLETVWRKGSDLLFSLAGVENLRKLSPDVALGLLSETVADDALFAWCRRINAFSWHPDYRIVTQPQIEALHELGVKVFPYTVAGGINGHTRTD